MCHRAVFRATAVSLVLVLFSGCVSHKYRNPEFAAANAKRDLRPSETRSADQRDAFGPEASELEFADNTHPMSSRAAAATPQPAAASTSNDFLAGRNAEDSGDLESAQELYRRVLENHPSHAYAHHRLGVVSDKLRQFDEAERHYKAALNFLSPQDRRNISLVFSDLGYSYLLQGDFTRSERALNNALAFDQNSRIALRNLALLHGYRGNFEQAYQTFARAGGETEARAELDRLFPNWQNQMVAQTGEPAPATSPATNPTAMNPAMAATITSTADRTGSPSSAFPTSAAHSQVRFPGQTSGGTEQVVARPVDTPPLMPASQSPVAVGQIPATTQPSLQAPPPSRRRSVTPPPADTIVPTTVATPAHEMPASAGIAPATYEQEFRQIVEGAPMPAAPIAATQPDVEISVESIQSGPNPAASRAALILGGAVGPGGMFPTTHIETTPSSSPVPPKTEPAPQTPPTTRTAPQAVIQQISAEFPVLSVPPPAPAGHVHPTTTPATATPVEPQPASPMTPGVYHSNTNHAQPVTPPHQYSPQYSAQRASQPNAPSAAQQPANPHMFPTSR